MTDYIIRRLLYAIPILIGVNILTFLIFFTINSPDDMARSYLGDKHITVEQINQWKVSKGYDKPLFYNDKAKGLQKISDTIFMDKSLRLFTFQFGQSDSGRNISYDISQRMWPSLAIALPGLFIGLLVNITVALLLVFFRGSRLDYMGLIACIVLMSISGMFYIIGGQYFVGKLLRWVPISGYESGISMFKFMILPVLVGLISGVGSGARWYRTLFLEEIGRDYVRTARAKGVDERVILFKHVLRNGLIPILTGVVVLLPLLFMGSLLTESFFSIPGLGSYTIEAIQNQDFSIVRVMVFLGAVLYIVGLILTDISYTLVDPRIRFS